MRVQKAGGIISSCTDPNKILLLYRGDQEDWSFPKGHVEISEGIEQAARREVNEETGLDVVTLGKLPTLLYKHPSKREVELNLFLFRSLDDTKLRVESSRDQLQWHSIEEALKILSYNLATYLGECSEVIRKIRSTKDSLAKPELNKAGQ